VQAWEQRPIQFSGWAFPLQRGFPLSVAFRLTSLWMVFAIAVMVAALSIDAGWLYAEAAGGEHASGHDRHGIIVSGWEGSAQGIAYSEFNHHLAGFIVLLMGCAELSHPLRLTSLLWMKLVLPIAMVSGSLILLIWSDHEAWPIGSLGLLQTFSGEDPEILQHKIYGFLLFLVGTIEVLRRVGRISDGLWSLPLPLFAIVGGLMLFGHSHGVHPSAYKIAMDHALMGTLAVTAGSSKLLVEQFRAPSHTVGSKWELLWAGLIVLIGIQLLMYSE
jgi:hypothetical protein